MKTSDNGINLIQSFEGLWLVSYDDATERAVKPGDEIRGTLTIGYGHTSAAGPPRVYPGMLLNDKDEADAILVADLTSVELEVAHLVKVTLNQNQFDALVSFQFNTNWLAHPHCSILAAINAGNYNLADKDFMLYDEASGHVERGLVRRRDAEMRLFCKPVA